MIPAAIVGGVARRSASSRAVALGGGGGGEDAAADAAAAAPPRRPRPSRSPRRAWRSKVPAGWSDSGDAPQVPGFADGAVSAGGPKGGAVVFGKADETAANSTLLADDLRAAAGDAAREDDRRPRRRRPGRAATRRCRSATARPRRSSPCRPTTGVATLACTRRRGDVRRRSRRRWRSPRATPSRSARARSTPGDVEGILARLEQGREVGRGQARSRPSGAPPRPPPRAGWRPPTPAPPRALGKLDVSPADASLNASLAKSLQRRRHAYKKAAAEARGKDRAGYKRQGGRAVAAGKDVDTAVDGLRRCRLRARRGVKAPRP